MLVFSFSKFHLIPYLDVLGNVLAPTLASSLPHAEDRARQLLDKFQLRHRLNHVPSKLSTGEQQRVLLFGPYYVNLVFFSRTNQQVI